jgi:hypothetical protein
LQLGSHGKHSKEFVPVGRKAAFAGHAVKGLTVVAWKHSFISEFSERPLAHLQKFNGSLLDAEHAEQFVGFRVQV